jgi:hypothetical protein
VNYHILNRPIHYDEVAVMRRILLISLVIALGLTTIYAVRLKNYIKNRYKIKI